MKNRLPLPQELSIFLGLSLICAFIAKLSGHYDIGLALMGAPIFLIASLMGFRRSRAKVEVTVPPPADPLVGPGTG